MESLELGATELAHDIGLSLGLDPLRGGLDSKAARQRENGVDDGDAILGALRGAADETLVDLDLGEVSPAQIAETAISLAEIVEDQPDAKRPQSFQRRQRRRVVAEEDAFGDFQLEPAGMQ